MDEARPSLAQTRNVLNLRISSDLWELADVAYDWSGIRTRRIRALKFGVSAIITSAALAVPTLILLGRFYWH